MWSAKTAARASPRVDRQGATPAQPGTQASLLGNIQFIRRRAAREGFLNERDQRAFAVVNARHISGMGIGLYVVREIVALHGDMVAVESVVGSGSTFTICLPLIEQPG